MLRRLLDLLRKNLKEQTVIATPSLLRNRAERRAKHRL